MSDLLTQLDHAAALQAKACRAHEVILAGATLREDTDRAHRMLEQFEDYMRDIDLRAIAVELRRLREDRDSGDRLLELMREQAKELGLRYEGDQEYLRLIGDELRRLRKDAGDDSCADYEVYNARLLADNERFRAELERLQEVVEEADYELIEAALAAREGGK